MRTQRDTVAGINKRIQRLPGKHKGQITDGYHTFSELYDHRCALFTALLNLASMTTDFHCWKSRKNADGSEWPGWFVCGIEASITYHLPDVFWEALDVPTLEKGMWDGHDSNTVLARLLVMSKVLGKEKNDEEE